MAEEQALVQLMDTLDGLELTKSEYEWLEQRFAAMTEKEQLLFRGAMKLEKPETASEAIDIWKSKLTLSAAVQKILSRKIPMNRLISIII